MLFGWDKVSRGMHFFATCIVAIGTLISAFWILSANSWMQTPTGFYIGDNGLLYPSNWLEVIFNPSFPYRFIHMITAAYLTTAFVVGGVSALYLISKRFTEHAKIMFANALLITVILSPAQLFIGDLHGLNTLEYQPAKVAAMEGIWETEKGAALRIFAIPDPQLETNKYELSIPKLASLILTHDLNGEVKGLKEWRKEDRPPVAIVFWSFRIMVGIGIFMIILSLATGILYLQNKLWNSFLLKIWGYMIPSGFIALLAGWLVTEIGRQPYTAYGVIKTIESVSPTVYGPQILFSLLAFVVIYTLVFGAGIYYMFKLISKGIYIIEEKEQFYAHGLESSIIQRENNNV
jgi:cytochrome d ubiquinol oxidase subunit I